MKTETPDNRPDHVAESETLPLGAIKVECSEIRSLLFEYLVHETGNARAELVRGHLLHCDACKAEAAELQSTVALLKSEPAVPVQLDEKRRRRLRRVVWHPAWNWIVEHHVLVSALLAAIGLTVFSLWLRSQKIHFEEPEVRVYRVWIGGWTSGPPGSVESPPMGQ